MTHYHGGTGWQEGGGEGPEPRLPVQRYFLNVRLHTADVMLPAATNPNLTEPSGDWVLYADHLAALRACEQKVQSDLEDEINLYRRHAKCDAWTRAGHRHGFLEVDQGDGDVLHFCGWDCALRYGATKEPTVAVA